MSRVYLKRYPNPQDNAVEKWRPIPGHEHYLVSDIGRVWSCRTGIVLKAVINHDGYRRVGLWFNYKDERIFVHRLVAMAFLPPPAPEHTVMRHLDGDSLNNCVENLKWGTQQENVDDTFRHGRRNMPLVRRIRRKAA